MFNKELLKKSKVEDMVKEATIDIRKNRKTTSFSYFLTKRQVGFALKSIRNRDNILDMYILKHGDRKKLCAIVFFEDRISIFRKNLIRGNRQDITVDDITGVFFNSGVLKDDVTITTLVYSIVLKGYKFNKLERIKNLIDDNY